MVGHPKEIRKVVTEVDMRVGWYTSLKINPCGKFSKRSEVRKVKKEQRLNCSFWLGQLVCGLEMDSDTLGIGLANCSSERNNFWDTTHAEATHLAFYK